MAYGMGVFKSIFLPFCSCCHRNYVYSNALCKRCIEFLNFKIKSSDDILYFFEYRDEYKKMVLSYKKDGQKALGRFFANGILKFLVDIDFDMVVSVPCSMKRKLFYGFDHMEYIGNLLAKNGINYVNILKRGWSKSQKLLRGRLRLNNLENKIKLRLKNKDIKCKRIVLIDDIVTTGTSMSFCEDILIKNGACRVVKLSISKVF
ncbi:amidophosphoribosyltransferase [Borrelia turcica IST7]|uniref:Amidophosphoribosyltransferase n=1 Tax=Borrelia turcica IST7 TaxID=1104446 RepID=A0A386PM37_9SPIR|nr:ComF family protein [Borrelia turcica]AYE36646.1 amidophosphoribosyltransferase [Borrelia turcica IST7]